MVYHPITLSFNVAGRYLLALIFLSVYLRACDSIPIGNEKIPAEEIVSRPKVRIPQGTVQGVDMYSHHERKFFGFKGIPYAEPPVGNLRFKPPVPAGSWNGTLDGSRDTAQCPQINGNVFSGDEDCLYLNVYTPRLPENENSTLLPVIIFVYGGGFRTGTNNPERWAPTFILDKDVIYVAPSYRMGVLGYLSTGDRDAPGNYALKDLVEALKWNRDNIRYFGGDPDRVTISGGSSGAICVHLLTLSDSTNGLFHRYITHSGSALNGIFPVPRTVIANRTARLATHLGCPTNTSEILVNCLRAREVRELVETDSLFVVWDVFPQNIWVPTIEQNVEGAFLTDTPANLFASGKIRDIPWICSLTRDEGIVYAAMYYERPQVFDELMRNIDTILPQIAHYHGLVRNEAAYTNALKSYYLSDLSADRNSLMTNFSQLMGDIVMTFPSYSAVQQHLNRAKNPVYLFSFEYRGTASYSYFFSGGSTKNLGVAHADELLYLIPGPKAMFGPPGYENSDADWIMVEKMVQLWTSFAINGTPSTSDSNGTTVWEPYSSRDNYLQIGNGPETSLQVKHGFLTERMQFLKELRDNTTWASWT